MCIRDSYITDLLPHRGKDQAAKTLGSAFTGENLNILAGSRPYDDEKISEKIKLNILAILNEKYDITEEMCIRDSARSAFLLVSARNCTPRNSAAFFMSAGTDAVSYTHLA